MLTRELARAVGRLGLEGRALLVAVSGGVDSVALLHGLQEISEGHGLKLRVGHVNHGLRGEESEADQRAVEELAARLGLQVRCARVDPGARRAAGGPSRDRPSPEEAARDLRHAALRRMVEETGADCIATAHTADDQAETVLLRLL